jgi:hypothetical protein
MRLINKTYCVKGVFDIEGSKKHPARLIGQGVVVGYKKYRLSTFCCLLFNIGQDM